MVFESLLISNELFYLLLLIFLILIIWEVIWKAIGMWKSARNNQLAWFICILIFNTAGILPIIYIIFFQKKHNRNTNKRKKKH